MKNIDIKIVRQPNRDRALPSFLLVYDFSGAQVTYYPAVIEVIIADIAIELEQCIQRTSHEVCISGYPVMTADFNGDQIEFAETEEDVARGKLIASVQADEFIAALESSMEQAVQLGEA